MLSDEDSRFLESWKERGESRYRLCCLFTLWARIEVTLSFEIFVLRLMQCILCLILYVTFFITLFLFYRIFICRIKFCGILYCIYIYMYVESLANKFLILRGLTRSKVTLLFNILYCILCFFFIFVLFLHSITTCVLYSILFSR